MTIYSKQYFYVLIVTENYWPVISYIILSQLSLSTKNVVGVGFDVWVLTKKSEVRFLRFPYRFSSFQIENVILHYIFEFHLLTFLIFLLMVGTPSDLYRLYLLFITFLKIDLMLAMINVMTSGKGLINIGIPLVFDIINIVTLAAFVVFGWLGVRDCQFRRFITLNFR
jgi:hypothetical protein